MTQEESPILQPLASWKNLAWGSLMVITLPIWIAPFLLITLACIFGSSIRQVLYDIRKN